jgi:hypothetical protein
MPDSQPFRRSYWLWLVVAMAGVAPRSAFADVTAAARAFARGQAAQLEGNYAVAAEHFELAFALQPSKEALRSAARMQMSAKNFARAATHAQALLELFAEDAQSAELARSILDEVAPGLARYEVSCTPECRLSVDHLAYFVEPARSHRLYLKPGRVELEAHFANGRTASRTVTTGAGETARLELEMPALPPAAPDGTTSGPSRRLLTADAAPERTSRSGLPVVVPWLTGAATVVCGGLTLWAGLDTQRKHDAYVDHPTQERWTSGVARQRLTNVLAASTAALGVATITLAFFVRGSSKPSVGVTPSLGPRSAAVQVAGKF